MKIKYPIYIEVPENYWTMTTTINVDSDEDPNKRDGVSWERTDENVDGTNWSLINTNSDSSWRDNFLKVCHHQQEVF